MNKKTILTLALAFCLVLAFVGNANAGPSEYYFDVWNNVIVEVSQLGTFFGNQWAIVVKLDLSGSPPDFAYGFSFYERTYGDLSIHLVRNAAWYSHTYEGVWAGSGSDFIMTTSQLYSSIDPLTTTTSPPALTSDSSADPTEQ